MKDISIIFCTDDSVKESIKQTVGNWSKKGLLKQFIFIDSYQNNEFKSFECINGTYFELQDLKLKLSSIDLDFIRAVSLTSPEIAPFNVENFIKYLNLPGNIEFCYLNLIVPTTDWKENKILTAGTHLANANILISPVDRPNPLRVPVDITNENYSFFASVNLISTASLWRGMERSPFDDEDRNMRGETDYIVARNFVRVLLGPDPVDGLIDSLKTDDGKWITPNKNYEYPANDAFLLKDFANKIINNFPNAFNFSEYIQNKSNKPIRFFEYIRRRYSEVSFDKPLPLLSTKMDTVNQLQEYLEENTNYEIVSNFDKLEEVNKLNRVLVSSLSSRGNTSIPKLWRDIRSIIFSLLDGSAVSQEYSEFKRNITINNINSIIPNSSSTMNSSENSSLLENAVSELEELENISNKEVSFFDNFRNKLFEQAQLAIDSLRTSIEEILDYTIPSDELLNAYKSLQKRAKFLDRVLALYLFNIIVYTVNQILINGGYVDVIINIPLLSAITPERITLITFLILGYWIYILTKLFNSFKKLNKDNEFDINNLINSSEQLVEFDSLLEQFNLWEEIYRLLLHESLDKRSLTLELDDSYIDFSPLLSIKGAVGSVQKEVIEEIQLSIIKEGWFQDIYKEIEKDFRTYSQNQVLRISENILDQIDSETTGFNDKDSVRYLFYKYLEEGNGNNSLKQFLQDNVKRVIDKTDSSNLFSEILKSGNNLSEFLKETEQSESQSEIEFDQNIWSNVSRVFEVQQVDRLNRDDAGSALFDVQSGSPIQRVIVRTDTSDRVLSSLIEDTRLDNNQDQNEEDEQDNIKDYDHDEDDY